MRRETTVKEVAKIAGLAKTGNEKGRKKAPLFSSRPAAGFPAPGDDQIEKMLDINDLVVENPASTFYVRVAGDSMEGAGIFDNDVLVVDRSLEPKNGSIVVAAVFGEMVVKFLEKNGAGTKLVSANEGYKPIDVAEHDDCWVWGVVVGSVRIFK